MGARRPGAEKGAHGSMAFELGHVDQFALVFDRQVDGFTDLLHQTAHDRPAEGDDLARPQKGIADVERADADHPDAVFLVEIGETALLQRGEQPVRGRRGKPDRLGEVGQAHAVGLCQAFEDRNRTIQRLNLPALGRRLLR